MLLRGYFPAVVLSLSDMWVHLSLKVLLPTSLPFLLSSLVVLVITPYASIHSTSKVSDEQLYV